MEINSMRAVCFILVATIALGLLAGCNNIGINNETYDNYSYGLADNGVYENIDKYDCKMPDLFSLSFTCDEVLEWGVEYVRSSGNTEIETVDDYVRLYGEELLAYLELTNKEVVEEGDIASVSLEFSIDGEKLEGYSSTNNYEASYKGDAIVSSLIGHKTKDVYDVEYVFPDDDADYPSKTAVVTITINSITMADPIGNGVVEANLDAISELLDGVVDAETYLLAIRPELAKSTLEPFVANYMQTVDFDVPYEYVECELYRLKARLYQIGYTYDTYLKTVEITDDEVREYCAMVAQENYMAMKVFSSMDYDIGEDELNSYYNGNREYIESVQGVPYMKLKMIRNIVLNEIVGKTVLTDGEGNVIVEVDQAGDLTDNADVDGDVIGGNTEEAPEATSPTTEPYDEQ